MDFSPKDRLTFDVDESDLSVITRGDHTMIRYRSEPLVKIVDFSDFSLVSHCLFNAFEGL